MHAAGASSSTLSVLEDAGVPGHDANDPTRGL